MSYSTELMRDEGPRYAETNLDRFPVEPWATVTNLIFLFIIIYWTRKTRLSFKKFPLISISMPILFIGYIGGTIYHATRSHKIWLLLDYMPILILILAAAIFLWQAVFKDLKWTFACTIGPVFIYRILTSIITIPDQYFISMGYTVLALSILMPAIFHCLLKNPSGAKWLLLAFVAFVVAIMCRFFDMKAAETFLPIGTHFLWHIFGGISSFFLLQYLYESEKLSFKNGIDAEIATVA